MANSDLIRPMTSVGRRAESAATLRQGCVIPAHPLALDSHRRLDERRQRALSRYYLAAGAGGLAVGVHTTQFKIHDPRCGLLEPVWRLAQEEFDRFESSGSGKLVRVAGICGETAQAVSEAELAAQLGYQFGLVNLTSLGRCDIESMIDHCRLIGEQLGIFGFYLQPAVGGIELPYGFWRRFCELENAYAIKVAAFDRYRTLDVVRAVADSGRRDIALYTGNDDSILIDLLTAFDFGENSLRFVGGLLGQWAVWTSQAVNLHRRCQEVGGDALLPAELLSLAASLTDANSAIFDAANRFKGCVPGIHEILRRQGLLAGNWCLDDDERLSPGQAAEIDRVSRQYPDLSDDEFVRKHLAAWLSD
ncbi:dihydrodipicolinate synthase family protein [Lacipirellula limnantheis]|nr:dihydrodipicolinate synthase family protein [Lacipirellula limnantheis]